MPAVPKPAVPLTVERRQRAAAKAQYEREQKARARERDGHWCRVPGCRYQSAGYALHVAHLKDKSLGGSHDLANLICICYPHHQGPRSIHSKDLILEPETADGCNGPVAFWLVDEQTKRQFLGVG